MPGRRVPGEFATIQAAVDASVYQDTIVVGPGLYQENVITQRKRLVLLSESGPEATIIDGGRQAAVVHLDYGGTIDGFTIRNGYDAFGGGGIRASHSLIPVFIRNNIIEDNVAGGLDQGAGGGIWCAGTGSIIEHNMIRRNYAGASGGGIYTSRRAASISNNAVSENGCHVGGGGIRAAADLIAGNIIYNNWADSFGGGLYLDSVGDAVENTIVGNNNFNSFLHGAGIHSSSARLIARNLVVHNGIDGSGAGIRCAVSNVITRVECNDAWGNRGGDYLFTGTSQCDSVGGRNLAVDPLFCDEVNRDFQLQIGSPCASPGSGGCGQIGALPAVCGVTQSRRIMWGELKIRYR